MVRPIDLPPHHVEESKTPEKREKPTPSSFKSKKFSTDPLHEELTEALKELLSHQKNPDPLSSPSLPCVSLPSSNSMSSFSGVSWQPSAQIVQLFEKMTSLLTYVHENGIQETTITLGGEQFSSSIFHNCTLTLTEYSTAPKIFNVQFAATPQALSFLLPHATHLQNALKQGKWDFRVERLDIELLDSRHEQEEENA